MQPEQHSMKAVNAQRGFNQTTPLISIRETPERTFDRFQNSSLSAFRYPFPFRKYCQDSNVQRERRMGMWIARFEAIASIYGWTEFEKLDHLLPRLERWLLHDEEGLTGLAKRTCRQTLPALL